MRSLTPRTLLLLVLAVACVPALNVQRFSTSGDLFRAGVDRFQRERWDDAIRAFEKLTFDLPSRDTLLPLAHWYLGQARLKNNERVLAAQSFMRLAEQFPDDSFADDALYHSGRAYAALWRRPELDPQYGILAQGQYRLLAGIFPESPFADSATAELARLDEWFATKDFETGMHYVSRRAYDSAIIYFTDVVAHWPNTDKARQAMLQLVKVYRLPAMNYLEDAEEVCTALRGGFPTDPEVLAVCKLPAADSTPVAAPR
ncbi:MAG: outer membrane protein assembly factor BamD [Gemmatimonadaceae bacterium]